MQPSAEDRTQAVSPNWAVGGQDPFGGRPRQPDGAGAETVLSRVPADPRAGVDDALAKSPTRSWGAGRIAIVAAVVVLLLAGGVFAVVVLTNRSTATTASGAGSGGGPSFLAAPKVVGQADFRDLVEHDGAGVTYNGSVVGANQDTFFVSVIGTDSSSSTTTGEVVLAAIDRSTGDVKWKVQDKDLAPAGGAGGISFECNETASGGHIICGSMEPYQAGEDPRIDFTVVNEADGTFKSSQVQGYFRYYFYTVSDDVLLMRSGAAAGDYSIIRVDPMTGKDKWSTDITFAGDDFSGASFRNGYVQVLEKPDSSSTYSTDLLNPDTGQIAQRLDGAVRGNGTDYYGPMPNTGGGSGSGTVPTGIQRVGKDGKIVWQNPDASFIWSEFPVDHAVLVTEDGALVGLDPANGKELWRSAKKFTVSSATTAGDTAFVSDGRNIRIINLTNGDQLGTANGQWVGSGSIGFYTTDDGKLYSWKTADGRNLWRVDYHELSPRLSVDNTRVVEFDGALFVLDGRSVGILGGA